MGKVVGNEPFIECQASDRDSTRLNHFYEMMARRVIGYRHAYADPRSRTRVYMGALNHLEQRAWRTAAKLRLWLRRCGTF